MAEVLRRANVANRKHGTPASAKTSIADYRDPVLAETRHLITTLTHKADDRGNLMLEQSDLHRTLQETRNELRRKDEELVGTKKELKKLSGQLERRQVELVTKEQKLESLENEFAQTKGDLVATKNDLATAKNERAGAMEDLQAAKGEISALQNQARLDRAELTRIEHDLAGARERLSRVQASGKERQEAQRMADAAKIADLERELAKTREELEKTKKRLSAARLREGELWAQGYDNREKEYDRRRSGEKPARRSRDDRSNRGPRTVPRRDPTPPRQDPETKGSSRCCTVM